MAKKQNTETPETKTETAASEIQTDNQPTPETETPETKTETAASVSADANTPKFTKEQILASRWFSHRRDILTVLLSDDEQYSHGAVDRMLVEFMKGKVK